jgi:predicted O-methyltransferase YrrM
MNLDLSKYTYTHTWFVNSEIRKNLLRFTLKNKKYTMLEIGCFEGLSACAFSDNILNHPESTLDCVDPYILSGTNPQISCLNVTIRTKERFIHNINKSKNATKINLYNMMSDEFFNNNKKTFNLIYIDGCHEPDFIKNDMENAFSVLETGGIMWMDDYGGNTSVDKCKIHMDKFLVEHKGQYKIIHKGYQLAIIKIKE